MATFYYRAVTSAGRWQEGTRQGLTEKAVARDLQSIGLAPVYVGLSPQVSRVRGEWLVSLFGQGEVSSGGGTRWWSGGRVTSRDRLLFTQELATLLNAGVPLDRALTICSELTENKAFQQILADVLRQVRAGKSLADALEAPLGSARGKAFSRLYVNMVRAGQASGTLATIFQRLAELEAAAAEWRSQLISSLIYPALLTAVAVASLAVLMNVVVPRFAQVFESTGLPHRRGNPFPALDALPHAVKRSRHDAVADNFPRQAERLHQRHAPGHERRHGARKTRRLCPPEQVAEQRKPQQKPVPALAARGRLERAPEEQPAGHRRKQHHPAVGFNPAAGFEQQVDPQPNWQGPPL